MTDQTTFPSGFKRGSDDGPKLIELTDLGVSLGLVAVGLMAWCLPERSWRPVSRALAPMAEPFVIGAHGLRQKIGRIAGRRLDRGAPAVMREAMAHHIERQLPYLRDYRPGGWNPRITVQGKEHLEAARAEGRGVVLWVTHFAFSSLVTKLGLSREGIWIHNLSHPRHGFNGTRFAMRFLNPVLTRIECRYLGERVMLGYNESKEALERLERHLGAGGVASVKVGSTAKRPLVAPFLDGEIHLGAGAPLLAFNTRSRLIPVHTQRDDSGAFTIRIEAPLDLPEDGPRGEALKVAAKAYAERLEPYVLDDPGQWLGWAEA